MGQLMQKALSLGFAPHPCCSLLNLGRAHGWGTPGSFPFPSVLKFIKPLDAHENKVKDADNSNALSGKEILSKSKGSHLSSCLLSGYDLQEMVINTSHSTDHAGHGLMPCQGTAIAFW